MKNRKKVSDFFIDRKMSLLEKEAVWLLVSDGDIVWVVGERSDDRFKVDANTKNVIELQIK
jgi:tRNA(Ile)-lysidine synthase